jgi:hypothetical protein
VRWEHTTAGDRRGARLADRHYSRQTIGARQFSPPGRKFVLVTPAGGAVWVTSFPYAEYVKHEWRGRWTCSLFRNESPYLSSELITEAVAATLALARLHPNWGPPPDVAHPIITMVNPERIRRKRDPGRCFRRAGWEVLGVTKEEQHIVLGCPTERLPEPAMPLGMLALA